MKIKIFVVFLLMVFSVFSYDKTMVRLAVTDYYKNVNYRQIKSNKGIVIHSIKVKEKSGDKLKVESRITVLFSDIDEFRLIKSTIIIKTEKDIIGLKYIVKSSRTTTIMEKPLAKLIRE